MNKKFYTLVASLLLAAGSGVYTPVLATAIDVTTDVATNLALDAVKAYNETTKTGGYIVGQSYFLGDNDGTNVLYVEGKTLKYATAASIVTTQSGAEKALWTLMEINAPEGAVAPQYSFVNKATGVVLAMNPSAAVALADKDKGISELGGNQTEWLQAPSYKDPSTTNGNPIYAALDDDNVVTFALKTDGSVAFVKMTKAEMATSALQINPFVLQANAGVVTLSPQELNTLLGKAGDKATRNSFFSLGFSPAATVNGERNIWADDLQAVAVKQFELAWGKEASDKYADVKVEDEFASLYPATGKDYNNNSFADHTKKDANDPRFLANENGFNANTAQWVALRNREGKFLVVDTAYIDGTKQGNNGRITFTYDDLYNARTETRFRNPKSYLFRFDYNPVTGQVEIKSMAYLNEAEATATAEADAFIEGKSEETFYAAYAAQAKKLGSKWTGATKTPVTDKNQVIKAALGAVTEVTLGTKNTADEPNNQFAISLGNSAAYVPTIKANTAYLLQIVGSSKKENIGKYIIDDLTGNQTTIEQAKRQNFQHMPAAQWILTSPTSVAGAPVTLTNREFTNILDGEKKANRTLYAVAGTDHAFFMGGDTLAFIPVTDLKDKYQGYKFADGKDLDEKLYTFDYLHELMMDRSINTVDNKDSVVWVDANGGKMNFKLVKVGDDAYGTNCGISSIAKLTRRIYKIKVEDATKLQNDNRYLKYDTEKKKYIVSTDADGATKFFLKENNEVTGESSKCYYTLVKPQYEEVITIPASVDLSVGKTVPTVTDGSTKYISVGTGAETIIYDNDVRGRYLRIKGRVLNAETGIFGDGQVVRTFDASTEALRAKLLEDYSDKYYVITYLTSDYAVTETDDQKSLAIIRYKEDANFASGYAASKVSVDNNTLNLVNGVIYDSQSQEVANSAFAVVPVDDPLYRRFNTENEGVASDAPDTVRFYRVNATDKAYLYEDAHSKYSEGLNFNFLGVEDKGTLNRNAAIFVDTAYVRGAETSMPQYMLAVRPNSVIGDTILCDASTHAHATEEEALACPHTKITPSYVDAWYLVNLQDSVNVNEGKDAAKFQWNNQYTRLGFVEARHIGDSLIIKNSKYTGNTAKLNPKDLSDPRTIASRDTIDLSKNAYNNAVFSFRLIKNGSNDFLIESDSKNGKIAPEAGSWIKIQNGVPVIATYDSYNEAGRDAEIFNVDIADSKPVANEEVAVEGVSVIGTTGAVIINGAAGKTVTVNNVLGQTLATKVLASDSETIALSAGIVIVAVDGEEAVKTIVK